MSSEANNGPEHAGRNITYFLGLRSDPRTHAVLGHIRDLKKHESYAPHALYFEAISYGNADELSAGASSLIANTDKVHLVFVCDYTTVSYINLSATSDHGCGWKVELGTKTLPHTQSNGTNSCDRQFGAARFLIGIFVKKIDEQLARGQLPWGSRPLTLAERKQARLGRQTKPINVPCHPGRWNTHRHGWDEHYDNPPGCVIQKVATAQ